MKRYIGTIAFILLGICCSIAQTPTKAASGTSSRVEAILEKMTLEEKIDYIGGTGFAVRPMDRLGVPALEMSDAPAGVRSNALFPSTSYPSGISLAASWNRELARRTGDGIGKDARARGIHFMLGPGVNIYRTPMNGRNFEYFGEDPFLASAMTVGYINGMQKQNVSATVKHFLTNNSEFDRHNTDSIVDERALREIYLPAFEAAVRQAHVGSIMDSYNLLNGKHLTQNGYFNVEIARKEWGFDGVVMSDWVATYDGVAAANNGLDLEMPTGAFMNRQNLLPAVQDGRVTVATLDQKVLHILRLAERFGWLDKAQTELTLSKYNEQNHLCALDSAREGMVLLKNENNVLPLNKQTTKSVLVVGPDAYPSVTIGGGSGKVIPFYAVSVLEGLGKLLGPNVTVYYEPGLPTLEELANRTEFLDSGENGKPGLTVESFDNSTLSGNPVTTKHIGHINDRGFSWEDILLTPDLLASIFSPGKQQSSSQRWTGYFVAQETGVHELAVQGSGETTGYRVYVDDKLTVDNWNLAKAIQDRVVLQLSKGAHKIVVEDYQNSIFGGRIRLGIANQKKLVSVDAKKLASTADAVIVAAGFNSENETEGADRTFTLPFGQDQLIREMASQNRQTIVAVTSGGSIDMHEWLEQVPALVEMWYPGEEGGTALAEILFGAVNPSGRLPVTFEKRLEDNPSIHFYYPAPGSTQVEYRDGIFVGYRGYEHNKVQPLFPFGYGLSYTTFAYKNLSIKDVSENASDPRFEVSFDVANTGTRAGSEVAQVYISDTHASVPRPVKELKGFDKISLAPGEIRRVVVPLDMRSFAYYDAAGKQWRADQGTFQVLVGKSSQQIELSQPLTLKKTSTFKY